MKAIHLIETSSRKKLSLVWPLCLLSMALPWSALSAALPSYLNMTGARQGKIVGSVTTRGREGSIEVLGFSHAIVSPRDPASGLPTGKRQHKPITIRKRIDKSTPLLFNALVKNENITEWKLDFWRPTAQGAEQLYYTISLVNANIASVTVETDPATGEAYELISFTYQKIIWTWTDGGITAEDDWESPVA